MQLLLNDGGGGRERHAIVAAADGWSASALAQNLGVDQMTIRKWLGKRT